MTTCPKCGNDKISTERRMDGNHICQNCRYVWPNKGEEPTGKSGELNAYFFGTKEGTLPVEAEKWALYSDAQAAMAERDAEIKRLRELIESAHEVLSGYIGPCLVCDEGIDEASCTCSSGRHGWERLLEVVKSLEGK